MLCFVDRASLSCKQNQPGAQRFLGMFIFVNLYMFRATMCPSSGETTVLMRHLVLVILCEWLPVMQGGINYICFSWWWAQSRPKHVENDKYKLTTKKFCTKLVLFTSSLLTVHKIHVFQYAFLRISQYK